MILDSDCFGVVSRRLDIGAERMDFALALVIGVCGAKQCSNTVKPDEIKGNPGRFGWFAVWCCAGIHGLSGAFGGEKRSEFLQSPC